MNNQTFSTIQGIHNAMDNFNAVFKQIIGTEIQSGKDQPETYGDLLDNAEAVREAVNNAIANLRQVKSGYKQPPKGYCPNPICKFKGVPISDHMGIFVCPTCSTEFGNLVNGSYTDAVTVGEGYREQKAGSPNNP